MKRNVLLVVVDSLRYDFISDSIDIETANIDSLAVKGINHTRAYASGPYTRASMPAVMSGTYSWMFNGYQRLSRKRPYIPDILSEHEYITSGFHSNPYLVSEFGYDRGFDHFFDGRGETSYVADIRRYITRALPRETNLYQLLRWVYKRGEKILGREIGTPYINAKSLNERVFEWLCKTERDRPKFCWIHYMDVHHPYVPHKNTVSQGIDEKRAIRLRQRMIESPEDLNEKDIGLLRTLYKGEIEFTDSCIGQLLDRIDEYWGLESTDVILTSDHGEAFGEHGRFGHTDILYDEVTRVPFVVWSSDIESRTSDRPASGIDILPTIHDIAGITVPEVCVGESKLEEKTEQERTVFTHMGDPGNGKILAFSGTWKFIKNLETRSVELYNIRTDPFELDDVSRLRPDTVNSFQAEINRHLRFIDQHSTAAGSKQEIPPVVKEQLEKLGYNE